MKKIIRLSLLFIILLSGCINSSKFKIVAVKGQSLLIPFKIALNDQMIDHKEFLISEQNSSDKIIKQLLSAKINLAILQTTVMWNQQNRELKKLAYYQRDGGFIGYNGKTIEQIGVIDNSLEEVMLRKMIIQDSLAWKVIEFKNIKAILKARTENEITAVCLKIPEQFSEGNYENVIWLKDHFDSYPNYNIYTSIKQYQQNPEKYDQLIENISNACKLYNSNISIAKELVYNLENIGIDHNLEFIYNTRYLISLDKKAQDFEILMNQK